MDYQRHYNLLISRAVNRKLEIYTENHHILPVSLGGTNIPSNIVSLTPEEHFVAHQLLVKIYPDEPKLIFSAHRMTGGTYRNNKLYGWLRKRHAKEISKLNIGKISNRKGVNHSSKSKLLVGLNNPKRKSIKTPFGNFYSAEDFCRFNPIITPNGLRILFKNLDLPITQRRAERCPLLSLNDIGRTMRDLGYSYTEDINVNQSR